MTSTHVQVCGQGFFLCLGKRQAAEAKKKKYNTTSSLSKPGHIDRYDTADHLRADSLCLLLLTYTHSLSRLQTIAGISIHTAYIIPTYLGSGPSRQNSKSSGPMHRTFHSGTPYMNKVLSRSIPDRSNLHTLTDLLSLRNATGISNSNSNTFIFTLCIASHRIARIIKVRPSVYPFRLF